MVPELLKEIAPGVTRVAVLRDTAVGSGVGQYAIIQAVAPSLGVELRPIDLRDAGEIERTVVAFARVPNGGLISVGAPSLVVHRNLIITGSAAPRAATSGQRSTSCAVTPLDENSTWSWLGRSTGWAA
jgi:hypothetical protein